MHIVFKCKCKIKRRVWDTDNIRHLLMHTRHHVYLVQCTLCCFQSISSFISLVLSLQKPWEIPGRCLDIWMGFIPCCIGHWLLNPLNYPLTVADLYPTIDFFCSADVFMAQWAHSLCRKHGSLLSKEGILVWVIEVHWSLESNNGRPLLLVTASCCTFSDGGSGRHNNCLCPLAQVPCLNMSKS